MAHRQQSARMRSFAYNVDDFGGNWFIGDVMNSAVSTAFVVLILASLSLAASAEAGSGCPVTLGTERVFPEPWPQAVTWYGSDSLATILPDDGIWSTTKPGARISVKVFWWSVGFKPGMEARLSVEVRNLDGSPSSARVDRPTNASSPDLGGTTMLTGIHFPDPGCWRISAQYLAQELTFVVETIDFEEYRRRYF